MKARAFLVSYWPALLLLCCLALPPRGLSQESLPEIPFDSTPDLLKLPNDLYLGEASGVAVNSKGHIFVFSRGSTDGPAYGAAAAQLLEFAPDGKYIREIGHHLYAWGFAHTVKVDREDNIWVTDKGTDMVVKFNPPAAWPWCSAAARKPPTKAPSRSSTSSRRFLRSTACSAKSPT